MAAVPFSVMEHLLVERSGLLLLLACSARMPAEDPVAIVAGAGVPVKGPNLFVDMAGAALVAFSAPQEPVMRLAHRFLPLTVWETPALQGVVAHVAYLTISCSIAAVADTGLSIKGLNGFLGMAGAARVAGRAPQVPVPAHSFLPLTVWVAPALQDALAHVACLTISCSTAFTA